MGEWRLEFDRAAREVPDDTFNAAKSTAELISATMGVASKVSKAVQVSKGAEEADSLWGLFNTMNNFATGIAEGDMEKVSDATLDVTIQVMELTLAGAAKTAYAAASASRKLADDLRGAGQCAEVLESSILAGFQNDLDLLSSALKDVSGARSLPKQEMQAKFKEVLTKTNGLPARLEKFSEQAALYRSSLEGCGQASKQAGELIRKGAAETGAEMVRK